MVVNIVMQSDIKSCDKKKKKKQKLHPNPKTLMLISYLGQQHTRS